VVLAAAQRMFGAAGFRGVSMEALADACDLNVRALYHHFPSKRALFEAAMDDAFRRFGHEVLERVFVHADLRSRVEGYVDVWRSLHESAPELLPFIGMVLVDGLAEHPAAGNGARRTGAAAPSGDVLQVLLETLVDDALARGEVHPDLDRDGALLLLRAIGMGLALAALEPGGPGAYPAMLDALDLLTAGTLFASPKVAGRRRLPANK
jgi:AcrR family transcriptional regulator